MIKKSIVVIFIILIISLSFTASAESYIYDSYYNEIYDKLESTVDNETWALIEEFGLNTFSLNDIYSPSFDKIGEYFSSCLWDKISDVRELFFNILVVLIISSTVKTFFIGDKKGWLSFISVSLTILVLTFNINTTVNGLISSMRVGGSFILAFIPIYTIIVSVSGNVTSAIGYNTLTVLFAQGISSFINYYAVDLIGVYFSVVIAFSLNGILNLNRFVNGVNKLVNTVLGFVAGVFTALLSIRGVLSTTVDAVSAKSIRFLLGSLIPVVGSSISDAYSSVIGSIGLLKGSVSSVGIVAMLLISVPSIIEGGVYCLTISLLSCFAEILNDNECASVLRAVSSGLKFVVILSVLQSFIMIISTGLMLLLKGGT